MAQETQLLKGVLEGCILGLMEKEASYGYLIVEKLKCAGFENIGEATVYPILTRLEKKGLLKYEKRPSDVGPPRKYYLLTDAGQKELSGFVESYKGLKTSVEIILKERLS